MKAFSPAIRWVFVAGWLLVVATGCKGTRNTLKADARAETLIQQGKQRIAAEQYEQAAELLEEAAVRPHHQQTTTALYLAGIAHLRAEAPLAAEQQFRRLIQGFPQSRYLPEARYHLGLILLDKFNPTEQQQGLDILFSIAESPRRRDLATDANRALQAFLYTRANPNLVGRLYRTAEGKRKKILLEAYAYQLAKQDAWEQIQAQYESYRATGGEPSTYVESLLVADQPVFQRENDIARIAVMLPFYVGRVNTNGSQLKGPTGSEDALMFYEGLQLALNNLAPKSTRKFYVEVFDTQKSKTTIEEQLGRLEMLHPDIIVGELFTNPSQRIGQWAREHETTQIVPLSANPELLRDSLAFTFLARPSALTHGRQMAAHAAGQLGLRKILVFTDQRTVTDSLVAAFRREFSRSGGQANVLRIDSVYRDRAKDDILDHFNTSLRDWPDYDGVYLPIGNQESAGLILSTLALRRLEVQVLGTPVWQYFSLIQPQEKERFNLQYSAAFSAADSTEAYQTFYRTHLKKYGLPPTQLHIEGYSLGMYLVQLLTIYNPATMSFATLLRNHEPFPTLHTTYQFDDARDNQKVHIYEFRDGTSVKVD